MANRKKTTYPTLPATATALSKLTQLHIVSFDNPYPPNYGGVIDVYYKIKALHEAGIKITLHAFEYGRPPATELNRLCEQVIYYPRRSFVNPFIGKLPYIVNTRNSDALLYNLKQNEAPILFEGLHTCFFLNHPDLKNRLKMVRMHNIEHDYYANLQEVENNIFKKIFFRREAARLKVFEDVLHHAQLIFAISENDKTYLEKLYKQVHHITAFHSNDWVTAQPGTGNFACYHGKLSVGENDEAARFLAASVFTKTDFPLQIAGDKPSRELKKACAMRTNISLFEQLNTEQISQKIQDAQINVLPTFQATGIKLKLINVLFQGRHVVVNKPMVANTGLEELCHVAEHATDFVEIIEALRNKPFTREEVQKRETVLVERFSNAQHARRLIGLAEGY